MIRPKSLDHVALWVEDREPLTRFACDHLGMHVIEQSDDFTLVGADARRGKLTLFAADGPREAGVLERVVLRVPEMTAALEALPGDLDVTRSDGVVAFDAPGELRLGLTPGEGTAYDLDHVVLRVPDPGKAGDALAAMGFERRDGTLAVADKHLRLEAGGGPGTREPLLNHLALLVDSAEEAGREAEEHGFEMVKVVDAENTLAAFVMGPAGIQVEYVEHKPGFSLV